MTLLLTQSQPRSSLRSSSVSTRVPGPAPAYPWNLINLATSAPSLWPGAYINHDAMHGQGSLTAAHGYGGYGGHGAFRSGTTSPLRRARLRSGWHITETFNPALERALLDPAYGKTLLAGRKHKDFVAVPGAKRCPDLLEGDQSLHLKHSKYAATPVTSNLKLRPLRNPPSHWLAQAGLASGLELAIGTSHYRPS